MKNQVQAVALRAGLRLEIKGMKRNGRSAFAITKQVFGFKGSKIEVYEQLDKWIVDNIPELTSRPL
jgi:hypothetical protein